MKIWIMEGSAYAEDGCTWYTGDKINADDIEVVKSDLAQSLADALEGMVREFEKLATVIRPLQNAEELIQARAALKEYRGE